MRVPVSTESLAITAVGAAVAAAACLAAYYYCTPASARARENGNGPQEQDAGDDDDLLEEEDNDPAFNIAAAFEVAPVHDSIWTAIASANVDAVTDLLRTEPGLVADQHPVRALRPLAWALRAHAEDADIDQRLAQVMQELMAAAGDLHAMDLILRDLQQHELGRQQGVIRARRVVATLSLQFIRAMHPQG